MCGQQVCQFRFPIKIKFLVREYQKPLCNNIFPRQSASEMEYKENSKSRRHNRLDRSSDILSDVLRLPAVLDDSDGITVNVEWSKLADFQRLHFRCLRFMPKEISLIPLHQVASSPGNRRRNETEKTIIHQRSSIVLPNERIREKKASKTDEQREPMDEIRRYDINNSEASAIKGQNLNKLAPATNAISTSRNQTRIKRTTARTRRLSSKSSDHKNDQKEAEQLIGDNLMNPHLCRFFDRITFRPSERRRSLPLSSLSLYLRIVPPSPPSPARTTVEFIDLLR